MARHSSLRLKTPEGKVIEVPVGPQKLEDKALFTAIRARDTDAAQRALEAGASPNAREVRLTLPSLEKRQRGGKRYFSNTALILAIAYRLEATVRLLVKLGADVNTPDEDGETSIMACPLDQDLPTLQLLITKGARVNQKDRNGTTALGQAARLGATEAMKLLLSAGADINGGRPTPLMLAVAEFSEPAVEFLLKRGANPNIRWEGETALDRAMVDSPTWKLILNAGGKGLSPAQHRKREAAASAEYKRLDEKLEQKEKMFVAALPRRDIGLISEDNALFEAFFQDLVKFSRKDKMADPTRQGPIFILSRSNTSGLAPFTLFGAWRRSSAVILV